MKPPTVRILPPIWRRRLMHAKQDLYSVESRLRALRVDLDAADILGGPSLPQLYERAILLKRIANYRDYAVRVPVRVTPGCVFFGKACLPLRPRDKKINDHQRFCIIAVALGALRGENMPWSPVAKDATKVLAYWRRMRHAA